ncbi:MAG: type II toxin-antitoxin system ParD family antitoxin [Proteobacteria bacterium]|nr:type II toxin-antitoxin system ParD family antitoxin [Pseudomonadota bacterium]
MINKSIEVTNQQDLWIKHQIEIGHFDNESEVVRELIYARQIQEQESIYDIDVIRKALIEGEKSGVCHQSIDEIWQEAR